MSMPIHSIQPIALPEMPAVATGAAATGAAAASQTPGMFQDLLTEASGKIESLKKTADDKVNRFLTGQGEEIHHVALAIHQSEVAMEMFMQVRNKVISAYQEVMRMQI